ncbi:host cell division inhibitor Icd-like protein [Xenorhabdus cabanillasii]|uniref:Bacteriophage protein n=1 Tax=Xenorhabdus cabanillasii JM26 TaxID=1427517 RepID=W1ILX5_9GAMM|nr:host cell division inhibitor Icd-like protein [Xenorhabdus cabanillasii]PHM77742.1 bacteriophage protein [Xenorhabdus cabanillasii JM26]CDL79419.1 putative bacteriophage protein [Xenorhabdus cabanillasii JM26]
MKIKRLHPSKRLGYIENTLAKSNVRRENLRIVKATVDATCVFFCVVNNAYLMAAYAYLNSMVALSEHPKGWLVSFTTSFSPLATSPPYLERENSGGDPFDKVKEIIFMMAIPTQTQFKFIFLCVKRSDITATPCRIEATAPDEHNARILLVHDFVLLFAGRLPVQPKRED